jgi:hypothetical protein
MKYFQEKTQVDDKVPIGPILAFLGQILDDLFGDDVRCRFLFGKVFHEDEAEYEVVVEAVGVDELEVAFVEVALDGLIIELRRALGLNFRPLQDYCAGKRGLFLESWIELM